MLVSCGFTVGAVLGGLVSASWMIPRWGWRSVFIVGGSVPIVMAVMMYLLVPESMQFQVLKGKKLDGVIQTLKSIDPTLKIDAHPRFTVPEAKQGGAPVMELFRGGRARATLFLWVVNFINLLNLYFLSSWLPTIATSAGLSTHTAVMVGTALQVGGVLGTLLMGPVIDRIGFFKVLVPCFLIAAGTITMIGQPGVALALLFAVVVVTGFCIIGGQPAASRRSTPWLRPTTRPRCAPPASAGASTSAASARSSGRCWAVR